MASEWRLALAVYGDGSSTGQFVHTFFNGSAGLLAAVVLIGTDWGLGKAGFNSAMSRPCRCDSLCTPLLGHMSG